MKSIALIFAVLFALTSATLAGGPAVWSVNSRSDVMKGDARGVSIDSEGTITLAPKLAEVYKTGQQFIWSSAVDSGGNVYLGTGGDGKVFKVTAAGVGSMIADLAEINVSALAIGPNGDIFAGTSPDGKVYRIDASGKSEVYFDPKAKYIWSLAVLSDGSLAVGTGDGGRIYKVRSANASPDASLLFDTSETHIISLAADKQGNLYAGTDSSGLVLRFGADGKPYALLDSPLREVHDLSIGPDGSLYAVVLGDSVGTPKADAASPSATPSANTVSVDRSSGASSEQTKSRYDLTNAKTAVYRIQSDGTTDLLWASPTVVGFSLEATPLGAVVGTSDKGRIFGVANDGRDILFLQTDASQVSTILSAGSVHYATSSNQGVLYRIDDSPVGEGTYDSAVLDAKTTASWGRIWWRSNGNVTIQTRSGNTEKPDESWSAWSSVASEQKGIQVSSPRARFFQWRATLRATGATLNEVNLSFVPRNIAPEILSIQVLPTNVGLAANPPLQVDPNITLSGMDPITFGLPNSSVPPRRVYQRGATSLQWTAEDRNGDKLVYDVYYKEVGDATYKLLKGDLDDNFLSIDGQSLADGRYIFKVIARDTPSNPVVLALAGERVTEPVAIDNTPPTIAAVGPGQLVGDKSRFVFDAVDTGSYLARAEYSVNGGDWKPVYADDGISDSPHERYTIEIPLTGSGEYAVTIRVYDVNGNSGNARAVIKK